MQMSTSPIDKLVKQRQFSGNNQFYTIILIALSCVIFRLIPSLTLSMSNIKCQFVATGPKEERSVMWMRASEEQIKSGVNAIKLENHEGLWIEKPDLWSKYLRRPDSIEEICFAQFAKMYKGSTSKKDESEYDANSDDDEEEVDSDREEDNDERKFHFIMTFRNNGSRGEKLPEMLMLENPFPGERYVLKKRSFPAALRFHKANKDNNHQRFMLNEIMLYTPLRDEVSLENAEGLYNEEFMGERKVQIVKSQVMEHLENVTEARYHVEQLAKEGNLNLERIGAMFDPEGEQENGDCENEGKEEHQDFIFCDPEIVKATEEKSKKTVYKQILLPTSDELRRKTENLDEYQKEVVNIAVSYARDIVKARKQLNQHPEPPLLMVHGGAGAGKSTVINVVAMWVQKILQRSGDSPDQPCVLKTAFTGCAASNIEGLTLHGAFGFSFSNKHFSLSDKVRDQRRATLKNLKLVIIDEISMVKSDMLYMLDLRLQEIKERIGTSFGGVAVLAFGDIMQLRPCKGKYIFEEPSNSEFKGTKSLWKMFSSIILEKNHRQGNDKVYADTLNRIRIGAQTQADMELLSSRIRPSNHEDIKKCSLYIGCKRKDIADINFKYILSFPGKVAIIKAVHFNQTERDFKPSISKKDGIVGSTSLQDELLLKAGVKLILVHNIDTGDLLTNGQLGTLEDIIRTKDKTVEILVIKLNDNRVGEQNRKTNADLASKYPGCVFIRRVSIQYTVRRKSGEVGTTATVIQFPVKLAYAITAHKIQGQSILHPTTVAMDLQTVFDPAQAYVMLSRVQSIDQLFIVDKLEDAMLQTDNDAHEEMKRLQEISFNSNKSFWHRPDPVLLKIATLNCAGLLPHFRDIIKDEKLKQGHIINLLETSLPQDIDDSDIDINGYMGQFINVGKGKGVASFIKHGTSDFMLTLREADTIQLAKFEFEDVNIISMYR